MVREKSRECHNHKPQPFPDPKRKRKPTNLNKHKPNKRTKSTKISSLFPKRGNRNTKRIEKHKNKITHGKTYNKSPRRINHKATKSKTNTGTTALERSVEQTTGGFKALLQVANFTLVPDATLNTEIHKNSVRSFSVIRRSFMPLGSPESLLTRCDMMADPTPASRCSSCVHSRRKCSQHQLLLKTVLLQGESHSEHFVSVKFSTK